jgi:hypothetical protein
MPPAMTAYTSCLLQQIKEGDDHISDARTIALAAEAACHDQFQAMLEWSAAGVDAASREQIIDDLTRRQQQYVIGLVLLARHRSQSPPSN